MSRSTHSSSLRTLGGSFRTKTSASRCGSGFIAHHEEEAEFTAHHVRVDPALEVVGTDDVADIAKANPKPSKRRRLKRQKSTKNKPLWTVNVDRDKDIEELEAEGWDRVGEYSIEKIAKIIFGIPSKADWSGMEMSQTQCGHKEVC